MELVEPIGKVDISRIPVVDGDAARRESVASHISAADEGTEAVFQDAARELPAGRYPVCAVSLAHDDPIRAARYLATQRGCEGVVFYGSGAEADAWRSRVNYEPFLPRLRLVVALDDTERVRDAFRSALNAVRARAAARPVVRRVQQESVDVKRTLESILLDAIAPPRELSDAYAAVVRGSLAGVQDPGSPGFPTQARRGMQSALRRIELLRGPEERDRVARALGAVLDRVAYGTPLALTRRVEAREDVPRIREDLEDVAQRSGLDDVSAAGLVNAVVGIVDASLANGFAGIVDAGYAAGSGEVTVTWTDDAHRRVRLFWGHGGEARPPGAGEETAPDVRP